MKSPKGISLRLTLGISTYTTLCFARHSRAGGNPDSFPDLDSRFRGSDNSSLRLKARGFQHS